MYKNNKTSHKTKTTKEKINAITNATVGTFHCSITCDQPLIISAAGSAFLRPREDSRQVGEKFARGLALIISARPRQTLRRLAFLAYFRRKHSHRSAYNEDQRGGLSVKAVTYHLGRLTQPHYDATMAASRQSSITTGGRANIATNKVNDRCLELVVFSFFFSKTNFVC